MSSSVRTEWGIAVAGAIAAVVLFGVVLCSSAQALTHPTSNPRSCRAWAEDMGDLTDLDASFYDDNAVGAAHAVHRFPRGVFHDLDGRDVARIDARETPARS